MQTRNISAGTVRFVRSVLGTGFPIVFCAVLTLIFVTASRFAAAAERRPVSSAAWLPEWDLDSGLAEAVALGKDLETLMIFAVSFDEDDQLLVDPKLADWLAKNGPILRQSGRKVLLTIVNDVYHDNGSNVAKDTDLVSRLMATPASREKHKQALLDILNQYAFDGLDMDYEKVDEKDWPVYLDFCKNLYDDLRSKGKTLRVVTEPKAVYYREAYPKGPEYIVMAYNLFGFHTKKGGPKCDMKFIRKLAAQRRKTGVDFRLALSLGGFMWKQGGKTSSLTESQAVDLADKHIASLRRDPGSAYQFFTFTNEADEKCEVWYADGQTLLTLMRTAMDYGFTGIDLWRLGGISDDTISTLKRSFFRQGKVLHVSAVSSGVPAVAGEGERGARANTAPSARYSTITSAIAAAQPGDTIYVAPGEYAESVVVDKSDLTFVGDTGTGGIPSVRITGTGKNPAVTDSANTLWRGFYFGDSAREETAELDFFTGRFEYCAFELGRGSSSGTALQIYGGSPAFHGCRFLGDGGSAMELSGGAMDQAMADFTYCLFDGFRDGLAFLGEGADLRFVNCLFTNNGVMFTRRQGFNGGVSVANSVLYFNDTARIVADWGGAEPVQISDCVYTPHINDYLWVTDDLLENQPGIKAERCRALSPRFTSAGRPILLNFGIDDVVNTEVWSKVADIADKHGIRVSLAVNTSAITDEGAEILRRTVQRGHEVGSHTADHLAVQPDPPLSVGYLAPGVEQARLTLRQGDSLTVTADGEQIVSIPFTNQRMNVNALAGRLERAGVKTKVSYYHGGTPVTLLSEADNLDITFAQPAVPLYTDSLPFIRHELSESLANLQTVFPDKKRFVFMCPFGVNSDAAKGIMADCGYYAGRSAVTPMENIGIVEEGGDSAVLDIYNIPSSSFQTARTMLPENSLLENFLLTLDVLKRRFSVYSIYSHTWDELSAEGWAEVLEAVSRDTQIRTGTLEEIAEQTMRAGKREEGNRFRYPVAAPTYDYRPGAGSPLIKAGEPFGIPFDFSGQPVPDDAAPNIGLYQ